MGRHPSRRHTSPDEAPAGRRIRRRRRELGLTQAELAGPEYTKSFISQLEGGYADPSLDTLRFLGHRLQLGLSTMAGDETDQRLSMLAGLLTWAESVAEQRPEAARRAVEIVQEIATDDGAHLIAADALLLLVALETAAGAFDRASALLDEVRRISPPAGARVAARTELAAGRLALRRGEPDHAAGAFRRALGGGLRSTRHPDLTVQALIGLAVTALQGGDVTQARRRLQSAVALAVRRRLEPWRGRALVRLALVDWLDDRREDALNRLRDALQTLAAAGDARGRIEGLLGLGTMLLEQGAMVEAGQVLLEARQMLQAQPIRWAEFEVTVGIARQALLTGDLDGAQRRGADAQALAGAPQQVIARARAAAIIGRVLAARGRHAEAVSLLSDALSDLGRMPPSHELIDAVRTLGDSARAAGAPETPLPRGIAGDEPGRVPPSIPWVSELA